MEPLKSLVSDLSVAMLAIDSKLVVIPAVDKTISRIYRDTRFSRNKVGATAWITKTFTLHDLLKTVAKIVS